MLYRVEGIVIRCMDYGEGNKIITLCTNRTAKSASWCGERRRCAAVMRLPLSSLHYGEYVFSAEWGISAA